MSIKHFVDLWVIWRFNLPFDLTKIYCQYQRNDSDTENYRLVRRQTHYDLRGNNIRIPNVAPRDRKTKYSDSRAVRTYFSERKP